MNLIAVRSKRALKWLAFTATFLLVLFAIFLRCGENVEDAIRQGKIAYTQRCGWLNLSHAGPDGPSAFLSQFMNSWAKSDGQPFDARYCQHMNGCYGPLHVRSSIERTYRVSGCSDRKSAETAAWMIFKDLSTAYENMQGSFPNAIDKRCQDSSFREGDLLGDRIAFYRALRGYSEQTVQLWMNPSSVEESISEFKRNPPLHERNWPIPNLPDELTELPDDPNFFARHIELLSETKTSFQLSWR